MYGPSSDYSDDTWTKLSLCTAFGLTLLSVLLEIAFKTASSSHGIGYSDLYLYYGAELKMEDFNDEPWALISSLTLSGAIAMTMVVYRIVKSR